LHTDAVTELLSSLPTPIELDLERVITTGGSAGGFLSLYLAMTYPDEIRACTASYPMLNQDGPVDSTDLDDINPTSIKSRDRSQTDSIVSSDTSEERSALTLQVIEDGTLLQYFSRDSAASPAHRERLYQLQSLKKPETRLPRGGIVIIHGLQDTLVPAKLSERFVNAARQQLNGRQGADRIVLSIQEGGHGFDTDVDLEESWLQEALQTAISTWLE
jgi:pimeloyl-ACP methyl ester carboxylesterase